MKGSTVVFTWKHWALPHSQISVQFLRTLLLFQLWLGPCFNEKQLGIYIMSLSTAKKIETTSYFAIPWNSIPYEEKLLSLDETLNSSCWYLKCLKIKISGFWCSLQNSAHYFWLLYYRHMVFWVKGICSSYTYDI